jgi:GTPase SAR1 family protein
LRENSFAAECPFPKICIVGSESTGKTSVLEALLGIMCLPKGEEINRSHPIEIKLNHIPYLRQQKPYVIFRNEDGNKKYEDFDVEIKEKLLKLSEAKTREPIKFEIFSNHYPDLTITYVPSNLDLIKQYINDQNTIILLCLNALNEIHNNEIAKLVRSIDTTTERTIGILTKLDQMDRGTSSKHFLLNEDESIKLKNGYIALKLGSGNSSIVPLTYNLDVFVKERDFFNSHPVYRFMGQNHTFTIDALTDKIKKLIFESQTFKKNMPHVFIELKQKIAECQFHLEKFGTEYIAYTNDNKTTYITSLINLFCEAVDRLFSGKMHNLTDNTTNHRLKAAYYDFLKEYKSNYAPGSKIKNEEIIRIIKLSEGDRLSGFPEGEVIFSLLEDEFENLRECVKQYLDSVYDIAAQAVKNNIFRVFIRFPKLIEKMEELINAFMEKHFQVVRDLAQSIVDMNFNYLYIDDKSLSYNELLNKFVIHDNTPQRELIHSHTYDKDHYYNVIN